jgi:hypothetical protein
MSRTLAAVLLTLAVSVTLFANQRESRRTAGGASVTGEVTAVSGKLITLAGGLVTIDATSARILNAGGTATMAAIEPGALIVATLQEPDGVSTAPLIATTIAVLRNADVTFTGVVQSVDAAGNRFVLLNRTVRVDAKTTFVNFHERGSLADLQPNMHVIVEADAVSGALVASRIILIAAIPPRPQFASGTVKSIGTDRWVIAIRDADTTFTVNASTRILGSPKAGDKVEVLYTVDSAHANVALSIVKSVDVPRVVQFNGVVKSVEDTRWVITRDDDRRDVVVTWALGGRILPVARPGDRVVVVATENSDGTYTAISILPRR